MPRHPHRQEAAVPLGRRLELGSALGRAYLAFLFVVVGVETALRTIRAAAGSPHVSRVSLAAVTTAFLIGGAASGLMHEALVRRARSKTDAFAAGAAAAIPFLLCVRFAVRGVGHWTLAEGIQLAVFAAVAGAVSSARHTDPGER